MQATILGFEAFGLQNTVLPRKYFFDVPSFHLGTTVSTPSYAVKMPDLFQLLTAGFWSTSLLWASTSIFIPLLFSYFYNLSSLNKRHRTRSTTAAHYGFDPLIFNIVKALVAFVVYGKGQTFGLVNATTVATVDYAVLGGYNSIVIGSLVGVVVSLYEAAQSK